jgi:hypothetical protein
MYVEGPHSTFTHDGSQYSVDDLLRLAENHRVSEISIKAVEWILDNVDLEDRRIAAADLEIPIIVVDTNRYGPVVLDGTHRVAKAKREGVSKLPAVLLVERDLEKLTPIFRRGRS